MNEKATVFSKLWNTEHETNIDLDGATKQSRILCHPKTSKAPKVIYQQHEQTLFIRRTPLGTQTVASTTQATNQYTPKRENKCIGLYQEDKLLNVAVGCR
jgi:hypothetical protein